MNRRIMGVPLVVAGLVATGFVLATGWTCPTGGGGYCSHAYIAGGWLVVLAAGVLLIVLGAVLVAAGRRQPPR